MQFTSHQDIFNRLASVGNLATLSPAERYQYEYYLKKTRDYHAEMSYARKLARKEGLQEGREEGFQQGRKEGIQQGMNQGMQQGMKQGTEKGKLDAFREMALRMKQSGKPLEELFQFTGIPLNELEKL